MLINLRILLIFLLSFILSACSLFGPVKPQQENNYVINAVSPCSIHAPASPLTLLVAAPLAAQPFNSNQIAYSTCPFMLSYFSKSFWIDTPPQMILPLMVQTLQRTCHFHAIVIPPFIGSADVTLNTELLQLQQDFNCKPSRVRLMMRAQLIDAEGHIVATRQFCIAVTAPSDDPYGGVIAANKAVACFLDELAKFVVETV